MTGLIPLGRSCRSMDAAALGAMDGTGATQEAADADRGAAVSLLREARSAAVTYPCYTLCVCGMIDADAVGVPPDRRNELSPRALVALRARDQQEISDGAGMPSLTLAPALPMAACHG